MKSPQIQRKTQIQKIQIQIQKRTITKYKYGKKQTVIQKMHNYYKKNTNSNTKKKQMQI